MGTVGTGVVKLFNKNKQDIIKKVGMPLEIEKVLVRDLLKTRQVKLGAEKYTTDAGEILNSPDIDIVVEVMGGLSPAKEFIAEALDRGKAVITANKDIMALHGAELFEIAERKSLDLLFEASVAGGIPIIRPLKECLAGNRIQKVMGIINGTTNYILTAMEERGTTFAEALTEAQSLGYAEADPTSDVEGLDAARKISILASIAFNTRVTFPDVYAEGISGIATEDIVYARELGYTIKLLGIAQEQNGEIEVRVHPVFIRRKHPLAAVKDVYNAIFVQGDGVGKTMFYGQGAGELPTASAVLGDIIAAARNLIHNCTGRVGCTCYEHKRLKPIGEVKVKFYLRLAVKDQPGVLATIAGVFGNQNVSIATVLQKKTCGDMAEIVLITHEVEEQNLRDSLKIIKDLSIVAEVSSVLRVEGSED